MTVTQPAIRRITLCVTTAAVLALCSEPSRANENGISFWLPGQFGSLAAAPQVPGWSLGTTYYHSGVDASGNVAAARQVQIGQASRTANINLDLTVSGRGDLVFMSPTYTFATPVLGGQFSFGVAGAFGQTPTNLAGTLTTSVGPITVTRSGILNDRTVSVADLYPMATLRWHDGVNNYMVYGTGDIPVGSYDATRLSNIGMGHGAIDFGGGYTYLNPEKGLEFSGVAGFTYNFKNPTTQYQSGVDFHFDWGMSHFFSKQLFAGFVGYAFQQISDDTGGNPQFGGFRSRVLGVGPQIGYLFPVGDMQGYVNLKGYGEFDAANRASGWNVWLTFAISPMAPTSTVTPTKHLVSK
jgi:hypothetical protein